MCSKDYLSMQPAGPEPNGQIQVERAIDEIHAHYSTQIGTKGRSDVAAIHAKCSTSRQKSIADQVRYLLAHALRLDLYVPRDLIFFDLAALAYTRDRNGLKLAEAALREKRASNFLLFSTSGLFRKTNRTLEFVDKIHRGLQVRCVFAQSGVDTNDKQKWETIMAIHSLVAQFGYVIDDTRGEER